MNKLVKKLVSDRYLIIWQYVLIVGVSIFTYLKTTSGCPICQDQTTVIRRDSLCQKEFVSNLVEALTADGFQSTVSEDGLDVSFKNEGKIYRIFSSQEDRMCFCMITVIVYTCEPSEKIKCLEIANDIMQLAKVVKICIDDENVVSLSYERLCQREDDLKSIIQEAVREISIVTDEFYEYLKE